MPYPGDQGPLRFKRTVEVLGQAPPAPDPIDEEFVLLGKTSPKKLVEDAKRMLVEYGVASPVCSLGDDPPIILLGEPRVVLCGSKRMVASKVLNSKIPGWGPPNVAPADDNGVFTEKSSTDGYYRDGPLGAPVFVHTEDEGQNFYDNVTACVVGCGMLFNMHSEASGQAVYHEILHTFEGHTAPMVKSTILKEGIVEHFADVFMKRYGLMLPIYPPYVPYVIDVAKLIKLTPGGEKTIAKAYFGNGDPSAHQAMAHLVYQPTHATYPAHERISERCRAEAASCQCFTGLISKFGLLAKDSWYRKWVAAHGGSVPPGGLAIPAAPTLPGMPPLPGRPVFPPPPPGAPKT